MGVRWVLDGYVVGVVWVSIEVWFGVGVGWVPGAIALPSARPLVGSRPKCLLPTIYSSRFLCMAREV